MGVEEALNVVCRADKNSNSKTYLEVHNAFDECIQHTRPALSSDSVGEDLVFEKSKFDIPEFSSCRTRTSIGPFVLFKCTWMFI